jgi:tetratricopeptide (TPR) repeat protein
MPLNWMRIFILFICSAGALVPASSDASLDEIASAIKSVVAVSIRGEDGKDLLAGSGFVIGESGLVVTSSNTAERSSNDASNLTIHTDKGDKFIVEKIIGSDKDLGLALLKVRGRGLRPLRLAADYRPKKGDHYYVVGSPRSAMPLVLDGIVETQPLSGRLDLELKVPPDNDGGPVLNAKGDVIGIIINSRERGKSLRRVVPVKQLSDMFAPYKKKLLSRAYYELGTLYDSEEGRTEDSIAAYRESVRLDSDLMEAYNNLGAAYGRTGRYQDAIEALNNAMRISPDYAEANFNLGVAYGKTGRFQESVAALMKLLRSKPDDPEVLNRLGIVYVRMGRYQDAIDASGRAVAARPEFREAYNNLGIAYGSIGRNKEAIEAFRKALKIGPDYADAHYLLAVIYLSMNDAASARNEYYMLKPLDKELAEKLSGMLDAVGK